MLADSSRAVFLSYASQDAKTARRICEALTAAGIDVWFDQSELRGGDEWDARLRQQIKSCAMFVPIISANTEERVEGYFRLEWDLAEKRTYQMARGVPFLLPLVIDMTGEANAVVPERFREVQWIRLPGGEPTPEFVERVKRLCGQPRRPVTSLAPESPLPAMHPGTASDDRRYDSLPARRPRSVRPWLWVLALVAAAVTAGFFAFRPDARYQPAAGSTAAKSELSNPALLGSKSIAILPFANLSPDPENAFFADGVHEDILTNLALIRDLRVISRTTAVQYRDTKKTLRQIGEELRVAYILDGSVRRSGNTVRVTGKLSRTATDEQVWAQSYTRDLTDIFVIQSQLATEIASALQAAISPQEKALLAARPTDNLAAYDVYLKAREALRAPRSLENDAEALLQAAVKLDPKFSLAWSLLSSVRGRIHYQTRGRSPADGAKAALETAISLAPESPNVIRARGDYGYSVERDYAKAAEQYRKLVQLLPNDADALFQLGAIERRHGRWNDSIAYMRRTVTLDPGNLFAGRAVASSFWAGRHYDEASAEFRRLIGLQPEDQLLRFELTLMSFLGDGSTKEVEEFLARSDGPQVQSDAMIAARKAWAFITGNFRDFDRLNQLKPDVGALMPYRVPRAAILLDAAVIHAATGDLVGARSRLQEARAELREQLAAEPADDIAWGILARTEAVLGHGEEAISAARKAMALMPEAQDAWEGPRRRADLAFVYAWTGDLDRAIAEYIRLLKTPWVPGQNIHEMKRSPLYFPLRDDPRFEALLNDPKNNAPLF